MADVTQTKRLLISRYGNPPSGQVIRNMIDTVQELMGNPLENLDFNIDTATGVALDLIGARLGFTRPPITATDIEHIGWAPEDSNWDDGVFATSARGEASNLPLGPMTDTNYRRMLKARGVFLRAQPTRAHIELGMTRAFGSENVRVTETPRLTSTQTVSLVGMTDVNGEVRAIDATGRRYKVNPFNGSYARLAGDLPSRTYSSLSFAQGSMYAISGNSWYEISRWSDSSVVMNTSPVSVTITPIDSSVNVSGPVTVGTTQYIATPTSLYSLDVDIGGTATRIGAFNPNTDIRGLASDGTTLYACDNAGAIRTVNITNAATSVYQSLGSTAINAIAISDGLVYSARARSLVLEDTFIRGNNPSFSVSVGNRNPFFLGSFDLHKLRLIPRPAGVGMKLRTHRI